MAKDYLFPMPELPRIGNPSYGGIVDILSTKTPTMSQFLPELEQVLSGRSQFLAPQINTFNDQLSGVLANLQGMFGKRGLTGSSIEAQGLATASGQGMQSLAQMLGNFSLEGANSFAQLLAQARQGDVNASRQLIESLAQAMGDELTSQRDQDMLGRTLKAQRGNALTSGLFSLGAAGLQGGLTKYSDRRLKDDIKPLRKVGPVQVVSFRWGARGKPLGLPVGEESHGVLAQDVRKVCPEAVGRRRGYLTVNYAKLARHLAAQEA